MGLLAVERMSVNPGTGDVNYDTAIVPLNDTDIDEASLGLRTSVYAGNMNLTSDYYSEVDALVKRKFSGVMKDGSFTTAFLDEYVGDTHMVGQRSGLYMNAGRIGYWDSGTNSTPGQWKVFIGNSGEFYLDGIAGHYLHWKTNGELEIKGHIDASSLTAETYFTGKFQTAEEGKRIVIDNENNIRFYSDVGLVSTIVGDDDVSIGNGPGIKITGSVLIQDDLVVLNSLNAGTKDSSDNGTFYSKTLIPRATKVFNLGSDDSHFKTLFIKDINISNSVTDWSAFGSVTPVGGVIVVINGYDYLLPFYTV